MNPTMSVFTIVHRALPPLSLPWKRRSLKGKAPLRLDLEISDKANLPEPESEIQNLQNAMHRDVFNVQVAVSDARHHVPQSPPTPENIQRPDSDSAVKPESRASSSEARSRVSWASIVCSRDRWTVEQERELLHAQRQLEKCQRDWSPKQEIWLAYVEALSEEKESYTGFLSARKRQQGDEQYQFRKAWKRRRSSGDEEQEIETANRLVNLRRLQRYSYSGQRLGAGSTAVAVKG